MKRVLSTLHKAQKVTSAPKVVEYVQKSAPRYLKSPPTHAPSDHLDSLKRIKEQGWNLPAYTPSETPNHAKALEEFMDRIKKDGEKVKK